MSKARTLAEILNKSKAVMEKTEQEYGTTSQPISDTNYSSQTEKEIPNLTEDYIKKNSKGSTRSVAPQGGNYRNLSTTKMPKHIVDAMVNTPIEIPESPNHTFELSDVEDLVNENVTQPTSTIETPVAGSNQTYDTKSIRDIVREEIGDVVREVVEEYLDKSLVTEDIKIKIGDTIFGGKLKPLPTKKKKRV
tara:strand:- start:1272 stop:1847 length:576 start_codon:yes stop_codon:yes gene_type:complete